MRRRLDDLQGSLAMGDKLPRGSVHKCIECEALYVGRAKSLYCSDRCANRFRQRRLRARNG